MTISYIIKNPQIIYKLIAIIFNPLLSDKLYLSLFYRGEFGKKLNWEKPVTFQEKLQWLKLNNRNPAYSELVDKYEVKRIVGSQIGEQYIIPTIGVWYRFEDIDWDTLPEQFVLKTTHDGGGKGIVICKNKKTFDLKKAKKILTSSLSRNTYKNVREWPYKNVKPRIIAEQYIEDTLTHDLPDYKFFCFNGEVKALYVATGRSSGNVKFDFFDVNFNHLDIVQTHPMSGVQIEKPKCFEEMKRLASILSLGMPHVRCDFYQVNGQVYFGELTFYHHGGFVPFHPQSWNKIWGDWITLPNKEI